MTIVLLLISKYRFQSKKPCIEIDLRGLTVEQSDS